ncbi:MAG: hypothetical protein AAGD10_19165 [Myxococcota bacterium]
MQLLAAVSNDAELMPSLVHALDQELGTVHAQPPFIWTVGHYGDGRALTRRRPVDAPATLHGLVPDVHSRVLLACRSQADVGEPAPHRFRRWLFGQVGDLSALSSVQAQVAERLPTDLGEELGHGSPGRLAFAMVLAELRRAGVLDDPLANPESVRKAAGAGFDAVVRMASEHGELRAGFSMSDGRQLLMRSAGVPLCIHERMGLEGLVEGPPDPARTDFKELVSALKRFRAVVVASDVVAPGWKPLPPGVSSIDLQLELRSEP